MALKVQNWVQRKNCLQLAHRPRLHASHANLATKKRHRNRKNRFVLMDAIVGLQAVMPEPPVAVTAKRSTNL